MDEQDPLEDRNSGQNCRLCLRWIDEALCAEQLVDVSNVNKISNSSLVDKIHNCLGIYINPDDAESGICLNCESTVMFICEFQALCHQTEKLYVAAQFRFNEPTEWQSYNDHISELRVLVRGQQDMIDNILDDAQIGDSAVNSDDIDTIFFPEFIKVEVEGNDVEQQEEYVDADFPMGVNHDVDPDEPVSEAIENSNNHEANTLMYRDTKFQLKLKIARELQAQTSGRADLKAVSKKMNLEFYEVKYLWASMEQYYREYRKRAVQGYEAAILRCRECSLFAVMNVLVPKFDGEKPYEEPEIHRAKEDDNGNRFPIDLQVAIAEEVKTHPELWDTSLKCTAHNMEKIWQDMTRKLSLEAGVLRKEWRRLRGIYRMYRVRELRGAQKRYRTNEKYDHLISVLHDILGSTMNIRKPVSSTEQKEEAAGEGKNSEFHQKEQQLALAREVQKNPILWYYRHPDFHKTELRDQTWEKISELLATDCEIVKLEWKRLRDLFRNRYLRLFNGHLQSDDPLVTESLYRVLDQMFRENLQTTNETSNESDQDEVGKSNKKFNKDATFEFAKVCHDHDILWNAKNPDYNAQDKRNEVWQMIALQFGISVDKMKHKWRGIRAMYRARYLRSQTSPNNKYNKKLETHLHQLLKIMFEEYIQMEVRNFDVIPKETQEDTMKKISFDTPENRMKLAEAIAINDILWNKENPDHNKIALREPVFAEVAAEFGHSSSSLKAEWTKLRRMHQNRQRLIALDRVDPTLDDENPLYTLIEKLVSSRPKTASSKAEKKYPKRRFTGRRNFDNSEDGCIKFRVNGTVRYAKICELCGKQVERSHFEYHMNAHNGLTPYACSVEGCNRQYSNKINRDRHEIVVHGEDGFIHQCDLCDRKFKHKAKFKLHYAVKHKSEELPCPVCGKLYQHKHVLSRHMRMHTSRFECPVCGKVLQKKYSLNVHMRVHTKEKPYPCELCDQRFMLKVQMKTHLLKVHGVLLEELEAAAAAGKS